MTYHRDRVGRHYLHFKLDCRASTPKSVKRKSRRSLRAAEKNALRNEAK